MSPTPVACPAASGSPLHLKNKYGKGFRLSVSFSEGQRAQVVDFVLGVAPTARHVGLATKGTANFELDVGGDASIAAVFERMAAGAPLQRRLAEGAVAGGSR